MRRICCGSCLFHLPNEDEAVCVCEDSEYCGCFTEDNEACAEWLERKKDESRGKNTP